MAMQAIVSADAPVVLSKEKIKDAGVHIIDSTGEHS